MMVREGSHDMVSIKEKIISAYFINKESLSSIAQANNLPPAKIRCIILKHSFLLKKSNPDQDFEKAIAILYRQH